MRLKFCIWGCGKRGKNLYHFMQGRGVSAFIDSNAALQGKCYQDVPVVSFEEYLEKYKECVVIITPCEGAEEIERIIRPYGILYMLTKGLPQEIIDYGRQDLLDIADKIIDKTGTVYLYGLNPFSVFLMDYYTDKQEPPVKIIPEGSADPRLVQVLGEFYPGCVGNTREAAEQKVYITNANDGRSALPVKCPVNLYDFLYDIEDYRNAQIAALKDIHKEKRCFIVGCGPSLRIEDLDRLAEHNEICISMNGIFKLFDRTRWRPDYYLSGDLRGLDIWKSELEKIRDVPYMLIGENCLERSYSERFIQFHRSWTVIPDGYSVGFSKDFSRGAYPGGTITYTCIQLAVYLGCQEIYLYGIDHYGQQKIHFVSDKEYLSGKEMPEWSGEKKERDLQTMENGYRTAKYVLEKMNIKIYNASRQTALNVFDRIDFDRLFQ